MTLDPQAAAVLAEFAAAGVDPPHIAGVAAARAAFEASAPRLGGPGRPVAAERELVIDGGDGCQVPARLYRPLESTNALVVALHGGGFVVGTLDAYRSLHTTIAAATGAQVLAVDYRLAPEHLYPAAVSDTLAATAWGLRHAAELDADPAQVGVLGDSAGATLAAVAARHHRAALAFQVLIYPCTDAAADHRENAEGYHLSADSMAWYWRQYLGADADPHDPDVSPLHAPDQHETPPALVVTAGYDPLRAEGEAYAEALRAAGTDVTHLSYPGQIHGFVRMLGVFDAGAEAIERIAEFVRSR